MLGVYVCGGVCVNGSPYPCLFNWLVLLGIVLRVLSGSSPPGSDDSSYGATGWCQRAVNRPWVHVLVRACIPRQPCFSAFQAKVRRLPVFVGVGVFSVHVFVSEFAASPRDGGDLEHVPTVWNHSPLQGSLAHAHWASYEGLTPSWLPIWRGPDK